MAEANIFQDWVPHTPQEQALLSLVRAGAYLATLVRDDLGHESDPTYEAGTLLDDIAALGPLGEEMLAEVAAEAATAADLDE